MIFVIRSYPAHSGVVHSFSGSLKNKQKCDIYSSKMELKAADPETKSLMFNAEAPFPWLYQCSVCTEGGRGEVAISPDISRTPSGRCRTCCAGSSSTCPGPGCGCPPAGPRPHDSAGIASSPEISWSGSVMVWKTRDHFYVSWFKLLFYRKD